MMQTSFRPRQDYGYWCDIPTRWSDNDVYGHVNNVVYYSWFDTAVNAMLVKAGLLDIHAGPQIGLVVETQCRYARPIAFPEIVQAGISVAHLGTSSVRYHVGIFTAGTDAAAAEGHFVHVYVDRQDRRPRPLDSNWRDFLESLRRQQPL